MSPPGRRESEPRHLFVVGVQRCGTTHLRRLLDDHPEIEMARPERPEPKALLDPAIGALGAHGYRARWFPGAAAPVLGEKSTSYLDHPHALERIARLFPDARVLVVLRDPVARAISHHRFSVAGGREDLPLERALQDPTAAARPYDRSTTSVSPYAYLARGHYAVALNRLWRHVDRRRTLVAFHEELVADPDAVASVYRFLGVDDRYRPANWTEPVNGSTGPAPDVPAELRAWLAGYYIHHDRELARLLGRRPAWAEELACRP